MKVFVTDGEFKHTLGAVRALSSEGVEVHAGATNRNALSFYSRYIAKRFIYPDPTTDAFPKVMERIDQHEDYDAILPVGDETWYSFVTGASKVLRKKSPLPPTHAYLIACNKTKSLAFARDIGISMPRTIFPDEPDEALARISYPAFVKPSFGSRNTRIVRNSAEAAAYRNASSQNGNPAVVQEQVQGEGCGFFALYNRGSLRTFFMHRRIREVPPIGGPSSAAETFYSQELLDLGSRLLDELSWHGVAMVEFRRDRKTGKFTLLEVNPKLWGSLDLAIAAGINFPFLAAQMVAFGDCNPPRGYTQMRYCWPIPDDFRHLRSKPSSLVEIMRDWVLPSVGKDIWLSDLGPHLSFIAVTAKANTRLATRKLHDTLLPVKPLRFDWVRKGKLAASAQPQSSSQLIWLRRNGIGAILDLTNENEGHQYVPLLFGGNYLRVPMRDHYPPTQTELKNAISFITDQIARGNAVLIHCLGGLGRTGTVLACYSIKAGKSTAAEAIAEVRGRRPGSIEPAQEASVNEYWRLSRHGEG
jgi:predicted ATP-grasp superfamily ATP-dependent carboligase